MDSTEEVDILDGHHPKKSQTFPWSSFRFSNPWKTWKFPTALNALWWKMSTVGRVDIGIPSDKTELDSKLPVIKPDWVELDGGVRVTWLGHACVLVQLDGFTVLTDPVFSERCSPIGFIGPKRYRDSPCEIDELPRIDAVVISHNHYDHLDLNSVKLLNARFGKKLQWFVPLGLASWMHDCNVDKENVTEMCWWEENSSVFPNRMKFIFTPAQHWCRRGAADTNKVLWGSWCLKGPKHSFFFAGDTGKCPVFEVIGKKFGPFDLAAIPIGAYEPRWMMKAQHVDPEEAVEIHREINARFSVGIHWGTFVLTDEHYLEPPKKLEEAAKQAKLSDGEFFILDHGESKHLLDD
ncbi:N-acyl-phosphatidylethanolamine-hydrolyzing phospholipase D-like [Tubulanus polymorphus]|uniref:N-acyl-phosphatidylethanolamine-hydrolyzing phospholipase D-like n=1 Tax=Tubulanus polymorphus TaxID=672921 RepID=UPI003DA41872